MKKTFLIAGLILSLAATGCSKSQQTDTAASEENMQDTPDTPVQAPTPHWKFCQPIYDAEMDAQNWADANNEFAFALLKSIPTNSSTVFSPYSIERAMGMVIEGACGPTASELRTALKIPDADNHSAAGSSIEEGMKVAESDGQILAIDNHLWIEKQYTLLEDYVQRMASLYHAEPTSLDFVGAPDESRKTINDFVAKATRDKIQDLLPSDSINPLTRLVLTNAVYFKSPWASKFSKESTKKEDFKTISGETIQVDMMHHSKEHRVYKGEAYVAFDLEFANIPYSLMVILPNLDEHQSNVAEALAHTESILNAEILRRNRSEMLKLTVNLAMPKFKLDAGMALRDMLQKLGVKSAFGNADFSGMSGSPDLHLSNVYHKAFIEVDEDGAEAAAATGAVMMKRSMPMGPPPIKITVDHPFLFAIIERNSETALFMGRIVSL